MPALTNILFDFGNILIDIDIPGAVSRIAELKSVDVDPGRYEIEVRSLVEKYEVGAISTDLFINGIIRLAHHTVQALDVIDAWNSMLLGIPEYRLSMLEQLRHNFGLYMLSNTNELHIAWVHQHLETAHGIVDFESRFFDKVYYSHLINARKPEPDAFAFVRDDAPITPSKTLFIDDMIENIESASRLGFQTMHSPSNVEVAESLKIKGFY